MASRFLHLVVIPVTTLLSPSPKAIHGSPIGPDDEAVWTDRDGTADRRIEFEFPHFLPRHQVKAAEGTVSCHASEGFGREIRGARATPRVRLAPRVISFERARNAKSLGNIGRNGETLEIALT